jgi:hypothetical protein
MAKIKSPFRNFSLSEVNKAEKNSYTIQIGRDFYSKDGVFVFTANQANKYYDVLLSNILYTMKNGDTKQKLAATKCLTSLHVHPFKLH